MVSTVSVNMFLTVLKHSLKLTQVHILLAAQMKKTCFYVLYVT
jgi:hypothetical protein